MATIKAQCALCEEKISAPKNPPHTPIMSAAFGERILLDLKEIRPRGFILVVVDHYTGWCWCKFLPSKYADGVAAFLKVVLEEVEAMRQSWPQAHREASTDKRNFPRSRPANQEDEVLAYPGDGKLVPAFMCLGNEELAEACGEVSSNIALMRRRPA